MYQVLEEKVQYNPLLQLHLFGMRIFGLFIFDNQKAPFLHWLRGVFFAVTFTIFNVTQYIDLVNLWGNVDEMTTNAATTLLFTTTVFRLVNFFRNRHIYTKLVIDLDEIMGKLMQTKVTEEERIIQRNLKYTKMLTLAFWAIALTTGNLMCIQSFVLSFYYEPHDIYNPAMNTTEPTFPPVILRSWFPFEDQWEHFYLVYAIQFYSMWVGMIIVPCWHAFIVALMIFAILRLQLLKQQYMHIEEYISSEGECSKSDKLQDTKKIMKFLENSIVEQLKIRDYVKQLEILISASIFLDFIVFSVLLCALLFQGSSTDVGVQSVIIVCYITTMIVILWMYYWHANEIRYHSEILAISLYNSRWYEQDLMYQKAVLQVILCSGRPITMQAGFVVMNLQSFINILRASYSYFTLLTQVTN